MWKPYSVNADSFFFPIFTNVIKQAPKDKDMVTITTINKSRTKKIRQEVKETYRFKFDWQSDDIVGVEVFKKVGNDNEK